MKCPGRMIYTRVRYPGDKLLWTKVSRGISNVPDLMYFTN